MSKYVDGKKQAVVVRLKKGPAIASAATIKPTANVFHVTGGVAIQTINGDSLGAGAVIMMIFDGVCTVKNGTVLLLAGGLDFTSGSEDTLTLVYDGTKWREVSRALLS